MHKPTYKDHIILAFNEAHTVWEISIKIATCSATSIFHLKIVHFEISYLKIVIQIGTRKEEKKCTSTDQTLVITTRLLR